MASARRSQDRRLDGRSDGGRWGAEYRCPKEKPRLDEKSRTPSIAIVSLGRKPHAAARWAV